MEDNLPQAIKLIYLDHGYIQKKFNKITVSFVRYYGKLKSKNIIKYNNNYFSSVFNSALKDYEIHLNELVKDINYFELNEVNERKNKNPKPKTTTTALTTKKIASTNKFHRSPNRTDLERTRKRITIIIGVVLFIIFIILICTGTIEVDSNYEYDYDYDYDDYDYDYDDYDYDDDW